MGKEEKGSAREDKLKALDAALSHGSLTVE